MANWKGRLSTIVAMLAALGLVACGSSETTNNSIALDDLNTSTQTVEPPPPPPPPDPPRYAFHEAVQRGLIEYRVVGNGASSGESLEIEVRRTSPTPFSLYIAPGTIFRARSSGVQNMVARSIARELGEGAADLLDASGVFDMADEAVHNLLVEAYCDDFHLDNPSAEDGFTAGSVDARAAAILEAARARGLGLAATQAAIWMDDGVTQDAIAERFDASSADFDAASRLLGELPPRG